MGPSEGLLKSVSMASQISAIGYKTYQWQPVQAAVDDFFGMILFHDFMLLEYAKSLLVLFTSGFHRFPNRHPEAFVSKPVVHLSQFSMDLRCPRQVAALNMITPRVKFSKDFFRASC